VPDPGLQLEHFLPYRLSVLANTISGSLAGAYARRFELRIPEWRVLAVLGNYPGSSARQVAERTAMDKVAVSRAIASLIDRGRVERRTDPADRRRSVLSLTSRGQRLLARIAPLARQYEQRLVSQLCPEDQATLDRLLATLLARARELPGDDGQRQRT
jgi:DNA-binding MarR family transcriptional regulator